MRVLLHWGGRTDVAVKDASEFNALRQIQTNIAKQVVLEDPASEVASIGAVAQSFDDSLV